MQRQLGQPRRAKRGADVTAGAMAELDLVPGAEVFFAVKATEVAVYSCPG